MTPARELGRVERWDEGTNLTTSVAAAAAADGGRGGGFSRDYKRQKRDDRGSGQGRKEFSEIKMENAAFEAYYKAQNIVPEGEWEDLIAGLRAALR